MLNEHIIDASQNFVPQVVAFSDVYDLSTRYIRQHKTNLALPGTGRLDPLLKAPDDISLREEERVKRQPAPLGKLFVIYM